MLNIIAMFAAVLGVIAQLGYFAQLYKIIKNKSANDISLFTYCLWLPSIVIWLIYGFYLKNIPLILTNTLATIGCLSVIISYIVYNFLYINHKKTEVIEDDIN